MAHILVHCDGAKRGRIVTREKEKDMVVQDIVAAVNVFNVGNWSFLPPRRNLRGIKDDPVFGNRAAQIRQFVF